MIIEYQANSNVGCVRENNEDMILVGRKFLRDESTEGKTRLIQDCRFAAIVADGMGGSEGGELASDIAIQEFDTWLTELPADLAEGEVRRLANEFAVATHALINNRGNELDGFRGMGTTLSGVFYYGDQMYWINVGDSRVYIFRDGILRQVSRDHSYRNLYNDPSQPANLIYNSLGGGAQYETFADCKMLPLFDQDRLLICSDGLSDMISDDEINALMQNDAAVSSFIDAAKSAGGNDNISVILLKCKE